MRGLAAQIMRGVGHHADIDAVLVMGIEEVLEHHGAAAFAPFRPALAVGGAAIVGRLLRRIDVRMPVDDHASFPRLKSLPANRIAPSTAGIAAAFRCLFRLRTNGGRGFPPGEDRPCRNWTSSTQGAAMVGHIDRRGLRDDAASKSWNSSHPSRGPEGGCSQNDLRGTGGNGLFYCFAAN